MTHENLRTLIESYTLIAMNDCNVDEAKAQRLARGVARAVIAELEAEHITNLTVE